MCANPELLFDVAKEGYTAWFFPLIGLGFLTLSLLLLWNERREPQNKRHWRTIFMVVFSALWTIVALFGTLGSYLRARSARASGNYQTVEGVVENFVPQPYNGHATERFTVSGVPFFLLGLHRYTWFPSEPVSWRPHHRWAVPPNRARQGHDPTARGVPLGVRGRTIGPVRHPERLQELVGIGEEETHFRFALVGL